MSQQTTMRCDHCGNEADKPSSGLPAGWLQLYGGRPYMSLDFCAVGCVEQWALDRVPRVQALSVVGQ